MTWIAVLVLGLGAFAWYWARGGGRASYQQEKAEQIAKAGVELRRSLDLAFAGVHDYREARDGDWVGLDRAFYRDACAVFAREQFSVVADLVDETLASAFPNTRTVMRTLLGDGGRVRAAVFHVRTRGLLRLLQVVGMIPRRMKFVECVSEIAGTGVFVDTVNTRGIDSMALPDSVQVDRLAPDTPPAQVLARHRERVAALDRAVLEVMADAGDMLRSVQRGNVIVSRFRAGIGPLTSEELTQLAGRPLDESELALLAAVRRDAAPKPPGEG